MTIKETLIQDIHHASPDLVQSLYDIWLVLKRKTTDRQDHHPFSNFFGSASENEANLIETTIKEEFSKIEGEW